MSLRRLTIRKRERSRKLKMFSFRARWPAFERFVFQLHRRRGQADRRLAVGRIAHLSILHGESGISEHAQPRPGRTAEHCGKFARGVGFRSLTGSSGAPLRRMLSDQNSVVLEFFNLKKLIVIMIIYNNFNPFTDSLGYKWPKFRLVSRQPE